MAEQERREKKRGRKQGQETGSRKQGQASRGQAHRQLLNLLGSKRARERAGRAGNTNTNATCIPPAWLGRAT